MITKKQLSEKLNVIGECFMRFPFERKEHYAWFLAQTYFYVRHSTRLLAMASSRFGFDQGEQHYGFAAHIAEETRHELLAVNDLKALGFSIHDFPELPETRSWYHSQYYYIQNVDPGALLGAVLALEGLSVHQGPSLFERICRSHGKNAASFLKVHATEDLHHIEGAFAGFDKLKPEQKRVALESLEQAIWGYTAIVEGVRLRLASGQVPDFPKAA